MVIVNSDQYKQSGNTAPTVIRTTEQKQDTSDLEARIKTLEAFVQAQEQDLKRFARDNGRLRDDINALYSIIRKS